MKFAHNIAASSGSSSISPAKSSAVGDHLRSVWNHIKFGWVVDTTPNFAAGVPIYFLGRRYLELKGELKNIRCGSLDGDLDAFFTDFSSRLWFSYRENFDPIPLQPRNVCFPWANGGSSDSAPKSTVEFRRRLSSCASDKVAFRQQEQSGYPTTDPKRSTFGVKRTTTTTSAEVIMIGENIPMSIRTSDCGWGCMLRSGQMLLAQALVIHFMGRSWVYTNSERLSPATNPNAWFHREIIRWFGDSLSKSSPLSIHHLVQASGDQPGTWFGPASVCRALVIGMAIAGQHNPFLGEFEIYLARDRLICSEEVLNLFDNEIDSASSYSENGEYCPTDHTGNYRLNSTLPPVISQTVEDSAKNGQESVSSISSFVYVHSPRDMNTSAPRSSLSKIDRCRGLLVLVPMRLGAGSLIDPLYTSTFLRLLRDPSCVGAVGGKPKHSVYIAGSQSDRLIYFDPHFCQPAVNTEKSFFDLQSWHYGTPKLMNVKQLDPSCAFGFYCGSRAEVLQLLFRLPLISELSFSFASRSASRVNRRLVEVVSANEASRLFSPLNSTTTTVE